MERRIGTGRQSNMAYLITAFGFDSDFGFKVNWVCIVYMRTKYGNWEQ